MATTTQPELPLGPPIPGAPWFRRVPVSGGLTRGTRYPAPAPTPTPSPGTGKARPFLPRVPDVSDERRLGRLTEQISSLLNSLIGQGIIEQTGPSMWTINGLGLTGGPGTVTSVGTGTGLTGGPVTASGTILLADTAVTPGSYTNTDLTVDAQGRITAASNGSGASSPLTTKGDLYGHSTVDARIPVGTDGFILTADSTDSLGVSWQAAGSAAYDPISSIYNPFTVGADDDEFDDESFSGFTAVNSGSHLPTLTEIDDVLSILHPGSDAAAELHAWMKTTTVNTDDYIECAFRSQGRAQNYNIGGLIMADGTTYGAGTQVLFYLSANEGKWALLKTTGYNTQVDFNGRTVQTDNPACDMFLRFKYEGSNHWRGYVSPDGISWVDITGQISETMTPTAVGFFVTTWGGTLPFAWSFRYFRHSA